MVTKHPRVTISGFSLSPLLQVSLLSDVLSAASILIGLSCHINHPSQEISGQAASPLFDQEVIHLSLDVLFQAE